ncbi:MAG: glutathione S-transferase [Beijerinckiaceae bacterium]|nr:glutathione S-transferase [Beijerinckiaceae bacterium]
MTEFRLHGFGESGNAYKVALMLELCSADWEVVPVDYFNGATRNPEWRADLNIQGEVPVLEHRGETLTQSGVILDYLAEVLGKFGARDSGERREIWRWILFDNHKFTSYYGTLRFFFGIQKTGETPITEFFRARARAARGVLDQHLAARCFVVGERPTIADFSLAGLAFYEDPTGIDDAEFPHIEAWKGRIRALPRWKGPYDLMPASLARG